MQNTSGRAGTETASSAPRLLSGDALQNDLAVVLAAGQRQIPRCDVASISLNDDDRFITAAATGQLALAIDEVQYDEGDGPCLRAARTNTVTVIDDMREEQRFQRFPSRALDLGVFSILSLPITTDEEVVGSLNLYSKTTSGYSMEDYAAASRLAKDAGATISKMAVPPRDVDVTKS